MKVIITIALLVTSFFCDAQTIPSGTCGLQYTYDNGGRVISREYVCVAMSVPGNLTNTGNMLNTAGANTALQEIEAIYPNPTTGKFTIRFTLSLKDAIITISSSDGKVVDQFRASGTLVQYDLSRQPSGIYFINVSDVSIRLTNQKIIKQ